MRKNSLTGLFFTFVVTLILNIIQKYNKSLNFTRHRDVCAKKNNDWQEEIFIAKAHCMEEKKNYA